MNLGITSPKLGFTLIELMIAVAIIGVLASVAIPAFNVYLMSSRSAEIPTNLGLLYRGAASYWRAPHTSERSLTATDSGHCLTGGCCGSGMGADLTIPPFPPTPEKRTGDFSRHPAMAALGFAPAGPVYGSYAFGIFWGDDISRCGLTDGDFPAAWAMVFFAATDLDGDNIYGGQSLQVGIRNEEMFRAPGTGTVADGLLQLYGISSPMLSSALAE